MNCKPGILAVVVRARQTPEILNRIVLVECRAFPGDECPVANTSYQGGAGEPAWWCRSAVEGELLPWRSSVSGALYFVDRVGIRDSSLRPINPPAADITDEEVRDLYAPSDEREVA